jgi:hypothetical protein
MEWILPTHAVARLHTAQLEGHTNTGIVVATDRSLKNNVLCYSSHGSRLCLDGTGCLDDQVYGDIVVCVL